ncbi:hypothetical protein Tco_0798262 [Tanacetum coccineum]
MFEIYNLCTKLVNFIDMALPPRDLRVYSLAELGGGARRHMSWRQFILALGLHTVEEMETVGFDFLGTTPSYTSIRDPILRLCYRLIMCSIAGRSQAPEKAWVPAGPARQEGDPGGVAEEAPVAPGGGDEDKEMPQAVPPPPRTQGERISQLEEETVTSLSRMMDMAGVTYTRYSESPVEYQRRNVRYMRVLAWMGRCVDIKDLDSVNNSHSIRGFLINRVVL